MEWSFETGRPIWTQLCERVRRDIVLGVYKPYEKLPGVRELAFAAEVNPNTMQRALAELEREGIIITRGTSGRFVCGDEEMISRARRGMLNDAAGEYLRRCGELGVTRSEAADILKGAEDTYGQHQ